MWYIYHLVVKLQGLITQYAIYAKIANLCQKAKVISIGNFKNISVMQYQTLHIILWKRNVLTNVCWSRVNLAQERQVVWLSPCWIKYESIILWWHVHQLNQAPCHMITLQRRRRKSFNTWLPSVLTHLKLKESKINCWSLTHF